MHEQKEEKGKGKTTVGKLEGIRAMDKKERSKCQIPQAYGIPICNLLTHLTNQDSNGQQALQEGDILQMLVDL
jgi:hypothetical protein